MKSELEILGRELLGHVRFLKEDEVSAAASPVSGAAPSFAGTAPVENPCGTVLDRLSRGVSVCRKCPLGSCRIKAVFGVGNPKAEVMFVGEGPGYDEDRKGEPFVGKAGRLLDKMLGAINLSRESVYITNIVKCHPMADPSNPEARGNDRPPSPEEINACRPWLDAQIAAIRPRCIVSLGAPAAKTLLNTSRGITFLRGKWHDYEPAAGGARIRLLPVYHPAALLRDPALKRETWEDIKSLRDFLTSGKTSGAL